MNKTKGIQQQKMQNQQPENEILKYHVGQNVDVKDSVGKWINAQILFAGNGTIYVHYSGWSAKYDQSIDIDSPRILAQWQPGKPIVLNNRIDAYHPNGGWLEARVIEVVGISDQHQFVKVHFFNYHKKYDCVIDLKDNNQAAIIGSRSKAFGMGKKRSKTVNKATLSEIIKSKSSNIKELLQQRAKSLQQNLQKIQLTIKKSGGDGNCLFRSISDQLYGDQKYYSQIRKICMDYISHQKHFFADYVAGDIDEYIESKRADGEWGDDIEIQAISEIYARPIEIYVFNAKPIRTFHEQNQNKVEPIRLAYVGSCHYDSIKHQEHLNKGVMDLQFGVFEEMFMSTYKSSNRIVYNRDQFSNCSRLEDTIEEQLLAQSRDQVKIEDELTKALEASQAEAILQQIQKSQLQDLLKKHEQQKIQEQLKRFEEKQIEEVKKMSKQAAQRPQKPYWFDDLVVQGFSDKEIWFAIEIKGFDPDAVQNFLLDNLCI